MPSRYMSSDERRALEEYMAREGRFLQQRFGESVEAWQRRCPEARRQAYVDKLSRIATNYGVGLTDA
jgi:hypothetical protein